MKILFGVRNDGADAYFRAYAPGSMMRYNGMDVTVRSPAIGDADTYDILVLQRHCDPVAELIMREFHDQGKAVVYDCDDWLFGIPPSWDCYGQYRRRGSGKPSSALYYHERMLHQADMVTCTTAALASRLLEYNDNVQVVPNCVMWGDWDIVVPPEKQVDGPIVGWFGLPYHWDTLKLLAPYLEPAILDNDAYLAVLGFPEVVQAFSPALAERTIIEPMVRWRDFHQMRRLISSFDLGLCWLEDTEFNRCKSPLRALQFGAAGVPMIASEIVYGDVLSPDDECPYYDSITPTPEGVANWITHALGRSDLQLRAKSWQTAVWKEHSYETQWHAWANVLKEACEEGHV